MKLLDFQQAKVLLSKYNIDIAQSELSTTSSQAVKIAMKMGFPVVMKIDSPKIIHKTESGAVFLNINSVDEVHKAYETIMKNAGKDANGIIIQKQARGHELIIGAKRDAQFGPVILFGMGGIFVEVMKDISIRIAPVTKAEAIDMIKETKAYEILKGTRGQKPVNIEKIAETIARLSNMIMDKSVIEEIDLNPCFVNDKECIVADARMMI